MNYTSPLRSGFLGSLFATVVLLAAPLHAAEVSVHKNPKTGLLTWTSEEKGFSIELIQLMPDFVRAVYSKHDFPQEEIERIASYCVFGSILKNTSEQQLTYKVSEWTYTDAQGETKPVKSKTQWLQEWQKVGITFSWTLLPDDVVFEVGDWQQGFTTIKVPRNEHFDLNYRWTLDGVAHTGTLKNLSCAPATLEQPQ
ncbi:MAG: hypothetical protein PF589_00200 [Gammaproteobacteria bacterium]|jgi:hypothetical protein|nr:hypothetical protein [Gammaproteobacteria bacterium]